MSTKAKTKLTLEEIEAKITELGVDQDIAEATSKKFAREAAAALVKLRVGEETNNGNNNLVIKNHAKFCREQAKLYAAHAAKIEDQIGEMANLRYPGLAS